MNELYDLVENYLEGELSVEEKSAFERRLGTDTELQEIYQERMVIHEALESSIEEDLRSQFRKIDAEEKTPRTSSYSRPWLIATLIAGLLIVSLAIWKQTSDINPQQIANTYTVDADLDTYRSTSQDSIYSAQERQYFSTMQQANKEMQAGQYEQSRATLITLDSSREVIRENQEWMTALTYYLENGRNDETLQKTLQNILSNPSHNCYNLAMRLDEEVNSFWGRLKN